MYNRNVTSKRKKKKNFGIDARIVGGGGGGGGLERSGKRTVAIK